MGGLRRIAAVVAGLALVAAGCGGGAPSHGARGVPPRAAPFARYEHEPPRIGIEPLPKPRRKLPRERRGETVGERGGGLGG